jgi:hypothetical protein
VAAWLRQGEIEAEDLSCDVWNPSAFQAVLGKLRQLTRQKDPNVFVPQLQQACASAGVAVVVARAPSGCRASGAVRFLSEEKTLLQLSFRYLTDDHFWFTFFHEAGHLLLHKDRIAFLQAVRGDYQGLLEGADSLSDEEEEEANRFAAEHLVPRRFQESLAQVRLATAPIIRLASVLGISPGIVVGQLQHMGRLRPNQFNSLKRRYRWQD